MNDQVANAQRFRNVFHDTDNNIDYIVIAFRRLTEAELRASVRTYLTHAKRKPRKNSVVEIHSIIDERIGIPGISDGYRCFS